MKKFNVIIGGFILFYSQPAHKRDRKAAVGKLSKQTP